MTQTRTSVARLAATLLPKRLSAELSVAGIRSRTEACA